MHLPRRSWCTDVPLLCPQQKLSDVVSMNGVVPGILMQVHPAEASVQLAHNHLTDNHLHPNHLADNHLHPNHLPNHLDNHLPNHLDNHLDNPHGHKNGHVPGRPGTPFDPYNDLQSHLHTHHGVRRLREGKRCVRT